jgi:hypothetical protein
MYDYVIMHFGIVSWKSDLLIFTIRTDNAIKNHWNSTMRRKYECDEDSSMKMASTTNSSIEDCDILSPSMVWKQHIVGSMQYSLCGGFHSVI